MKFEFSRHIFENTQTSNFMKIYPVRTKLFHVGGQRDRRRDVAKLIVAFRNSADGTKGHELFAKLNVYTAFAVRCCPLILN